jgi:bifunctional DNA-binding transcriptional regulator/antitoxin component of YhaV-PrlF toxin-antitoxin module
MKTNVGIRQWGEKMAQLEQVQKVMAGWRVTIFNEARERLKIKQGDFVIVRVEDGALRIIPAEVKPKAVIAKEKTSNNR